MTAQTLTIVLDGEIALREFARVIGSFYELVSALTFEFGTPDLDWMLDDLQVSSAIATARASNEPESAARVALAFAEVGHALESGLVLSPHFSRRVTAAASKVVTISDSRVRSVRFETPARESVIAIKPVGLPALMGLSPMELDSQRLALARPQARGAIKGRIQALSNRGGLRFTLYDLFSDKAVGCYVAEGKEELLRNVWGKLAVVEGLVTRDPLSGRPMTIRQVSNVTLGAEFEPGNRAYEAARGVLPTAHGLSAEDAVRKVRDAQ